MLAEKNPCSTSWGSIPKILVVGCYRDAPRRELCLGSLHFIAEQVVFFDPDPSLKEGRKLIGVMEHDGENVDIPYRLKPFAPDRFVSSFLFSRRKSKRYPFEIRYEVGSGADSTRGEFLISQHHWRRLHHYLAQYLVP